MVRDRMVEMVDMAYPLNQSPSLMLFMSMLSVETVALAEMVEMAAMVALVELA